MTPVTPLLDQVPRSARSADRVDGGTDFGTHLERAAGRGQTDEPDAETDTHGHDAAAQATGAAAAALVAPGPAKPAFPPGLAIAIAHAPDHAAVHEAAARHGVPTAESHPSDTFATLEGTQPDPDPTAVVDSEPVSMDDGGASVGTIATGPKDEAGPAAVNLDETAARSSPGAAATPESPVDTDPTPVDTDGASVDTDPTPVDTDPTPVAGDRAVSAGVGRTDGDGTRGVRDWTTSRRPLAPPRDVATFAMGSAVPANVGGDRPPGAGAPVGPPPITPAEVADRVLEAVRSARAGGQDEVRLSIRLDPPELGSVTVDVAMRGDRVHVTMRADIADAATALHGRRADIVRALDNNGLGLAGFDVGSGHDEAGRHGRAPTRPGTTATRTTPSESDDRPAPADDGVLRI